MTAKNTKWLKGATVICLLVIAYALSLFARNQVSEFRKWERVPSELAYLPNKHVIKTFSLGFRENVADYYWLKAIQYFGDKLVFHINVKPDELSNYLAKTLYPVLDLVTDLAPDFKYVYRFGQVTLTLMDTNADLAIELLKKGQNNVQQDWMIPYYLGFDYYFYKKDYKKAASYYHEAARLAPLHMKWLDALSARLYTKADDPELAVMILASMLENMSTKDPEEREHFEKLYKMSVMKRDLKNIQNAKESYFKEYSRQPDSINELVKKGMLDRIPEEPHGGKYLIDKEGKVISSRADEH